MVLFFGSSGWRPGILTPGLAAALVNFGAAGQAPDVSSLALAICYFWDIPFICCTKTEKEIPELARDIPGNDCI